PLTLSRPRDDRALSDREVFISKHEVDVHRHACTETGAGGAGAERRVERERTRLDLCQGDGMPVRARQLLGVRLPCVIALLIDEVDLYDAAGQSESRLHGVGDASEDVIGCDKTVDDDRDIVLVTLLELRRISQLDELAVDDRPRIAFRAQLSEEIDELPLLLGDDRSHDLVSRNGFDFEELIADLLLGMRLDSLAARGKVMNADAGPEQSHVVVDLGDRADR